MKKVVYIAHPISGDVRGNMEKVAKIIRDIAMNDRMTIPFAPYFSMLAAFDDIIPEERERGMVNNLEFFSKGFIDELWIYGEPTKGMQMEIAMANEFNIPIIQK